MQTASAAAAKASTTLTRSSVVTMRFSSQSVLTPRFFRADRARARRTHSDVRNDRYVDVVNGLTWRLTCVKEPGASRPHCAREPSYCEPGGVQGEPRSVQGPAGVSSTTSDVASSPSCTAPCSQHGFVRRRSANGSPRAYTRLKSRRPAANYAHVHSILRVETMHDGGTAPTKPLGELERLLPFRKPHV